MIAGSRGKRRFCFGRTTQTVFQKGHTHHAAPLAAMCESSYSATSWSAFGDVSVPNVDHPNMYVVVFHCCLNLHFSDVDSLSLGLFAICLSSLVFSRVVYFLSVELPVIFF